MTFRFLLITLSIAFLSFFPITYYEEYWLTIFPLAYIGFIFIKLSIAGIKNTFGRKR